MNFIRRVKERIQRAVTRADWSSDADKDADKALEVERFIRGREDTPSETGEWLGEMHERHGEEK